MNWKQLDVVLVMIFISSTICLQVFIAVWDFDSVQVSKKNDSERLTFKTPNIVLIFSNEQPIITKISKDRWNIFNIVRGDLIKRDMSWTSY